MTYEELEDLPPMGWDSWESFNSEYDPEKDSEIDEYWE